MADEIADMPGIEAAMERFAQVEGTQSVKLDAVTTPPAKRDSKPAPRAAEPANDDGQSSESQPIPDTRATAEKPVAPETDKSKEAKPGDQPEAKPETKAEAEKSRYAKSQERLVKTWDAVNAEKATVAAEKSRLESERAEFARKQAEFQAIQKAAEQPQYKPEDYTNAATEKRKTAAFQRAEAKRLDDAGKYAEAQQLERAATKNEAIAEDLTEHAEKLAKNPPTGFAQRQAQYQQAKQAWTIHAAKEFPDLAKEGSEFQQGVAAQLTTLAKMDAQLAAHPSMIYHVSRLVAEQLAGKASKAEAARVPGLVKETESLRAKIKELEALTSPAGGGGVARLGNDAPVDDYATLRQMAESGAKF